MPHLAWLTIALPFFCGCEQCPTTVLCFTVTGVVAAGLFVVLAIARELWLLQIFRGH